MQCEMLLDRIKTGNFRFLKTLASEDIYIDPHKLEFYLESGEVIEVVRDGQPVARLVPRKTMDSSFTWKRPPTDYRARSSCMLASACRDGFLRQRRSPTAALAPESLSATLPL
jgi:antitoxin (DNA-binding transcriptional repressor) of toxin-antitoxin stability system